MCACGDSFTKCFCHLQSDRAAVITWLLTRRAFLLAYSFLFNLPFLMVSITGLEGTYLLPADAVNYQPVVMVVSSSSSLAGMWCWRGEEAGAWAMWPKQQSDRLEETKISGKYSEVMGLKGLSSRGILICRTWGGISDIPESQHNSIVSKYLKAIGKIFLFSLSDWAT